MLMSIEFCCIIYIIFTEVDGRECTKIIEKMSEKSEHESRYKNAHFGIDFGRKYVRKMWFLSDFGGLSGHF